MFYQRTAQIAKLTLQKFIFESYLAIILKETMMLK